MIDRRKVKSTLLDRKERGDPMFRTNPYEYFTVSRTLAADTSGPMVAENSNQGSGKVPFQKPDEATPRVEYNFTGSPTIGATDETPLASFRLNKQGSSANASGDAQNGGLNSGIAARTLGANVDYTSVQHGNSPSTQNTSWNGQRIRSLRKRMRLSARKFGHVLGFPGENCHVTIYRHESDKIKPSKQTVMILEQLEKTVPQA